MLPNPSFYPTVLRVVGQAIDLMHIPGERFTRLVDIMRTLRSPGGCPWDREQTETSMAPHLLEEAYEAIDAIERGEPTAVREELGDVLMNVLMIARIGSESGRFDAEQVASAIADKLIRRHPHVFGTREGVDTPGRVLRQWEQIKAREQAESGQRRSVLGGLPKALPALLRAYEIGTRVAAVGFDWAHAGDVVDKIEEEVAELRRAIDGEGRARAEEEMGDLLFSIANLSRKLGIEPESALRRAA